jgi:hypothetical protein
LGIVPTFLGGAIAGLAFWIWMRQMASRNNIAERIERADT